MIKRVKATKIGDVFEVKISDNEKRYMQYVISNSTLNIKSSRSVPDAVEQKFFEFVVI